MGFRGGFGHTSCNHSQTVPNRQFQAAKSLLEAEVSRAGIFVKLPKAFARFAVSRVPWLNNGHLAT